MTATDTEQTERAYTTSEVLALVGCPYRWLDYALRCGYLRTEADPLPGSGRYRAFTGEEIDVLHAAYHLAEAGFRVDVAFRVALELGAVGQYVRPFGDIYEIQISVRSTAGNQPTPEETP